MQSVECPKCGKSMRRGSTFCMGCGERLPEVEAPLDIHDNEGTNEPEVDSSFTSKGPENADLENELPESILEDNPTEAVLPESELPEIEETVAAEAGEALPPPEGLSWEVDDKLVEASASIIDEPAPVDPPPTEETPKPTSDFSWDDTDLIVESDEVKEGMPFKEVAPPRVFSGDVDFSTEAALDHLFPNEREAETREAVIHLFPEGRGHTGQDFIDVVVGKPTRVDIKEPMPELEEPACPGCGSALAADGFVYPPYVFEAMGKARLEAGEERLKEKLHEKAIESFEMAMKLFDRAGNGKMVADARKKVDEGYDAMASEHFQQGENHRKVREYEWAIVQFKKARELYMFTTDPKMRAKCSEKARECYVEWGRELEDEGDKLAKAGMTRDALAKYQDAAKKYREGDAHKKLKDLEKKIMKA